MRRRWSIGVAVAIAAAISSALASQAAPQHVASADPLQVTIALQTDGVELRIAQGRFALKLEF